MDVKTNLVVSGTHTIESLSTAGFVKNSASGLFSSDALSKARAHCNTAATVAASPHSLIPLDDADYDTDSIVDLANDRIEPTKAGCYLVTAQLCIVTPASLGWSFAAIWKNGAWLTQGTLQRNYFTSDVSLASTVTDWVVMNGTTDYIELRGYASSTKSLDSGWHPSVNYITIVGPF